jgi:hypothetical protein
MGCQGMSCPQLPLTKSETHLSRSKQVIVQSYSHSDKFFSGVMRAHGVAAPSSSSTTFSSTAIYSSSHSTSTRIIPTDVLTHFTAHIIDPLSDGLFSSVIAASSPEGKTLEPFKVSRQSEAESWIQLGPFKGLSKEELLTMGKNREWVEERTRGWILFRLKERGLVNVTGASALSFLPLSEPALTLHIIAINRERVRTVHCRSLLLPSFSRNGRNRRCVFPTLPRSPSSLTDPHTLHRSLLRPYGHTIPTPHPLRPI